MRAVAVTLTLFLFGDYARAGVVVPTSYDMLNGESGYWAAVGQGGYWDRSYSGAGNRLQDLSPLSGGRGQLTDGRLAARRLAVVGIWGVLWWQAR